MRRGFHIFRGSRHVVRDHLNAKKRWQRVRGLPRIFPGRNVAAEFQFAMQKVRRLVPLSSRWISDAWWMPTCTAANYYALVGGSRFSRDLSRFPIERLSARPKELSYAFQRCTIRRHRVAFQVEFRREDTVTKHRVHSWVREMMKDDKSICYRYIRI